MDREPRPLLAMDRDTLLRRLGELSALMPGATVEDAAGGLHIEQISDDGLRMLVAKLERQLRGRPS